MLMSVSQKIMLTSVKAIIFYSYLKCDVRRIGEEFTMKRVCKWDKQNLHSSGVSNFTWPQIDWFTSVCAIFIFRFFFFFLLLFFFFFVRHWRIYICLIVPAAVLKKDCFGIIFEWEVASDLVSPPFWKTPTSTAFKFLLFFYALEAWPLFKF